MYTIEIIAGAIATIITAIGGKKVWDIIKLNMEQNRARKKDLEERIDKLYKENLELGIKAAKLEERILHIAKTRMKKNILEE